MNGVIDMGAVRETFTKVMDVLQQGTELEASYKALSETVSSLRQEIESVRGEMQTLRDTNHWLDSQITELRQQRDQAKGEAADLQGRLVQASHDRDNYSAQANTLNEQVSVVCRQRDEARKERDDALMRQLALEEEANALRAKLAQIEAVFAKPQEPAPVQQAGGGW